MLPALTHKVPKIIAANLNALTAIVHNYGCKVIEPKPILKALPKAYAHADKNVRAEAQNLTIELYRWLKDAMKPLFWSDLKPVQQTDLEKCFESVKQEPSPKQERFTRAQQAAMASAPAGADDEDGEGGDAPAEPEEEDEIDAFDLAEPVDVVSKIPSDFHDNLASKKWKDRKEALDALYALVNVPKIKDGPFGDIVGGLAKCMKDANVAVVTVAANCVEALANGLRSGFSKHRGIIMGPIMERLKEKKQSVSDALGAALDAVFVATGLSDCLPDIIEFLKHKNPQVKQGTVKFLIRCLKSTRDVPDKGEVKAISEASTKLLTDSDQVTRAGGAEALGTLMKIMGERAMNPFMEGLDGIRKSKIKEYFETAEVKAKDRPKPIVGPPKKAAGAPAKAGTTKRVVKKPAGTVKKTAAAPSSAMAPPEEEPPQLTSPAKPAARGPPSKLGGLAKPGGSGLKLQRKLAPPGSSAGTPQQLASPQPQRVASPSADSAAGSVPQPKFGLGRGGLTSRPLGRPAPAAAPESAAPMPTPTPHATGLSAVERAELEELRMEREQLTKLCEDLRSEKMRLTSEILELQNQNAQLIEDHTRDVLSIKAKETQLVRARSDAEAAEQTTLKQQREVERLKRELSRALRASAVSPPNPYANGNGDNMGSLGGSMVDMYPETSSLHSQSSGGPISTSRVDSRRSYLSTGSGGDEKENRGYNVDTQSNGSNGNGSGQNSGNNSRLDAMPPSSPSIQSRRRFTPPADATQGQVSPIRRTMSTRYSIDRHNYSPSSLGTASSVADRENRERRRDSSSYKTSGDGENWKRAAEVTSQLKARIEQMKARQGLTSRANR